MASMDDYLNALSNVDIPDGYDKMDIHRDFRRVFLDSAEGRRVLKIILTWGYFNKTTVPQRPGNLDLGGMAMKEGERNLALKIWAAIVEEPDDAKPEKQVTRSDDDARN